MYENHTLIGNQKYIFAYHLHIHVTTGNDQCVLIAGGSICFKGESCPSEDVIVSLINVYMYHFHTLIGNQKPQSSYLLYIYVPVCSIVQLTNGFCHVNAVMCN